ncbi:MarR family winged helix-turn-helix transcriptional regulator [Aureimonas leprariae]|uniref:MarR family transcriptional regulator n=1 Tax=Plantimonas leprariae TaxID=2615207 RepID=A0A7V7PP85_9HYPH|nr:MarR family transcriptional regulator [Aureimonas leprariae]KAB0679745.1 MarR family transcriptional regulator [Aureimonas leprariae]
MPSKAAPLALDDQICFALYGASMAVGRTYKPLLDRLGITYPQYLVLSALWERDASSVGAIADRLMLESSTVTPLLKRLAEAGLVRRERNPANERQVIVRLTADGHAMRERTRCLGERLLGASGMTVDDLKRINRDVRVLRDALAAGGASDRSER